MKRAIIIILCMFFVWIRFLYLREYVCVTTPARWPYILYSLLFSISLSSFHFIEYQNPKCVYTNNTQFQAHAKIYRLFFVFRFRLLLLFLCVWISCVQFHGSINSNTRSRNGAILSREFALMRPKKNLPQRRANTRSTISFI